MKKILTAEANERSGQTSLAMEARAWVEAIDLGGDEAGAFAVSGGEATTGPAAVRRAYALYRTWQERDLGSVRLLRARLDGGIIYLLHTTTDGDDSFIEVFDAKGTLLASGLGGFESDGQGGFRPKITWDDEPFAVRERVAPRDASAEVAAFLDKIAQATGASSAGGESVTKAEVQDAVARLVGAEITTSSVDDLENAALHRVLADPTTTLSTAARSWAEKVGALYLEFGGARISEPHVRSARDALALEGATFANAKVASAEITNDARPDMSTFIALTRRAFDRMPARVVPVTRGEARRALEMASFGEVAAKKAVEGLASAGASLYLGELFREVDSGVPRATGVVVLVVSADGKGVAALAPAEEAPPPPTVDARAIVRELLAVDREVLVVNERPLDDGIALDLRWRPEHGGLVTATLTVPSTAGEPSLSNIQIPWVLEPGLRDGLAEDLASASGGEVEIAGWVGRDNAKGPGFVVAWRPTTKSLPLRLSDVRIQLGGTAVVTDKKLSKSQSDTTLARDLAVVLAREHMYQNMQDPATDDVSRLAVALYTNWDTPVDPSVEWEDGSPVGFDPEKELLQLGFVSVWGDNAVFVTYAKDGTLRVEDMN